jgi:hypothetical protein
MVARFKTVNTDTAQLHLDILPASTRKAFLHSTTFSFLPCASWYLAGGTALALQVGHRQSVDLDFFSLKKDFRGTTLERHLLNTGSWNTTFREDGTLYGLFKNTKMSLIAYPFFIPHAPRLKCDKICVLSAEDIAVMKVIAISQRGRKRDFVDLYWYCLNQEPLSDLLKRTPSQYDQQEKNIPHILKSLVYFEDADGDPMPELFFKADWKSIKAYFRREVSRVTKQLLGL